MDKLKELLGAIYFRPAQVVWPNLTKSEFEVAADKVITKTRSKREWATVSSMGDELKGELKRMAASNGK